MILRDAFSPTTLGLIKAMGNIAEQAQRRKTMPPKHPKYTIEAGGLAPHGTRYIGPEERKLVEEKMRAVQRQDLTDEERTSLLAIMHRKHGIRFVRTKRAHLNDRSRYSGSAIRTIAQAGGGPREQARAARRAQRNLQIAA